MCRFWIVFLVLALVPVTVFAQGQWTSQTYSLENRSGQILVVNDQYVYFLGGDIHILDVTQDPAGLVGRVELPAEKATQVAIHNDHLYVRSWTEPSDISPNGSLYLSVFDVTDPRNPSLVMEKSRFRYEFDFSGDYMFAIGWDGVEVFNISDPANWQSVFYKPLESRNLGFRNWQVVDGALWLTDEEGIHRIYRTETATTTSSVRLPLVRADF